MDAVRDLSAKGTTVIMVCHDMEVVADYAQRAIVMTAGQVVADGATFDVFRNEAALNRACLLPPQIVEVSLRLEVRGVVASDSEIARANTLDEMTDAIAVQCAKKEGAL